jgi:hypothetical protein
LIVSAKAFLSELNKAPYPSNKIYFRILCLSVEKIERTLRGAPSGGNAQRRSEENGWQGVEADMGYQTYVPKEFMTDWNFPGLTFCWIPFDIQDMFMDFGQEYKTCSSTKCSRDEELGTKCCKWAGCVFLRLDAASSLFVPIDIGI